MGQNWSVLASIFNDRDRDRDRDCDRTATDCDRDCECACDCSSATPIAPGLTCNPSSGPTRAMYCLAPEGSIAPPLSANACAASGVVV